MSDENGDSWFSAEASTFGDRVVGAREAAGMSQAELARRLGVKLRTVTGWEEDRSEPRANKLQMLAGMLNVSIRWLLTGEGEGVEAPQEDNPLAADTLAVLAEMRQIRIDMARQSEKLGRLEKRLRGLMREAAK